MSKRSNIDKIRKALLAADSRINDWSFFFGQWLRESWLAFSSLFERIHVRGFPRFVLEGVSESLLPILIVSIGIVAYALPNIKDSDDIWTQNQRYSVVFTDVNGNEIGQRGIMHNNTVPLEEFPPVFINAVLATEDSRFFSHFGIDIIGTLRALMANVRASGIVQGGSTLTQQLAKNLFLSSEKTIRRKINEAFLALWIEARLSKKEILKLYLDRAYMGAGAFGAEAAAQTYFGKSIRDVNLAESAMLAGLFKAPSRYSPARNLPAARARAAVVLDRMVSTGFATQGEVISAKMNPATVIRRNEKYRFNPNYFLDYAFAETKKLVKGRRARALRVKTTVDPHIQQKADYVILSALRTNSRSYNVDQAALAAVAPDGAIRALVGGKDYGTSQFNRATDAKRQPGSSFKPFVYLTALRDGYRPYDIVYDSPVTIGDWSPKNYNRRYRGEVTLTTALKRSINTIPIKLAEEVGRKNIIRVAQKLGIHSKLVPNRSLPLGTSEVSVLEMAGAYATFANGGRAATPYSVLEIRTQDGDRVIYNRDRDAPKRQQIFSPSYIADLNMMLAHVITDGTGRRARLKDTVAAGKTGTTQGYRDAWFVGYTAQLSTAVWFGNDDYRPMRRMTGGSVPAMTWQRFMTSVFSKDQLRMPRIALLRSNEQGGEGRYMGEGFGDDAFLEDERRVMSLPYDNDPYGERDRTYRTYRAYRSPFASQDNEFFAGSGPSRTRITGDIRGGGYGMGRVVRKRKDFTRRAARSRNARRFNNRTGQSRRWKSWQNDR
ncbi:MAG TPA: PBP1A family penicillin-binding protein [Rhizobiales bacterium]|nr:PBP1A family penicillin-binding protein [Hyphomicrobiales bacterium]